MFTDFQHIYTVRPDGQDNTGMHSVSSKSHATTSGWRIEAGEDMTDCLFVYSCYYNGSEKADVSQLQMDNYDIL